MLAAIHPMLNEEVQHWLPPIRDIYGNETFAGSTTHRARVVTIAGKVVSSVSRTDLDDAKAEIWLLNHPRPLTIGETFELPNGDVLNIIRAEARTMGRVQLSKVWLS